MTLAALDAQALDACLARGEEHLAARFFRAAARAIAPAWLLTTSEDLRHPGVVGIRSFALRVANWYTGCVFRATTRDPVVLRAFLEVMGLVRSPASLLRPPVLARALARGLA
jgi:hypothetical protein